MAPESMIAQGNPCNRREPLALQPFLERDPIPAAEQPPAPIQCEIAREAGRSYYAHGVLVDRHADGFDVTRVCEVHEWAGMPGPSPEARPRPCPICDAYRLYHDGFARFDSLRSRGLLTV